MKCANCGKSKKAMAVAETAKRGNEDVRTRAVCSKRCADALADNEGAYVRSLTDL